MVYFILSDLNDNIQQLIYCVDIKVNQIIKYDRAPVISLNVEIDSN